MQKFKKLIKLIRDNVVVFITIIKVLYFKFFNKKKTCIMVTNGMGYGGAPLVLLEAAKVYIQKGYNVVIMSEYYGELINICKNEEIHVWINPRGAQRIRNLILSCDFEFAFVNTIVMYEWVVEFSQRNIYTIWWIHEGDTYIDKYSKILPKKLKSNVKVLTVSNRSVDALKLNGINYDTEMLYYGMDDLANNISYIKNEDESLFTVLVMGSICARKNQLFAIRGYEALSEAIKKQCKFIFVGAPLDEDDIYYRRFIEIVEKYPEISYIPKVERDEITKLYCDIDALICCSVDDPLPVVVTECLMFGKKVILSSTIGQHSLIEDGYNGYIFVTDNVHSLCAKIEDAYENKDNDTITRHAREIYDYNFTKELFYERLMYYTEELLLKKNR